MPNQSVLRSISSSAGRRRRRQQVSMGREEESSDIKELPGSEKKLLAMRARNMERERN